MHHVLKMRFGFLLSGIVVLGVLGIWNFSSVRAQTADLTTGLVGYWTFDEGTGTVASDSSGHNNTGTLKNGPLWTTGKLNTALQFDGIDDYVEVANSPSLSPTSAVSVSFWIKSGS